MKKRLFKTTFVWILLNILVLSLLVFILERAWQDFSSKPLMTVLNDPLHPIKETDFPIVTFCSNNRLSKQAVKEYATKLSLTDSSFSNVTYFMEKIKLLTYLYSISSDAVDINELLAFEKYLENTETNENKGFFDSFKILKMLTPKCENLLINCQIGGITIPCNKIIQTQSSEYGNCCTFNISDEITFANIKEVFHENYLFQSFDTGLTMVINGSTDDHYSTLFSTKDNVVHIYTHNKFDDSSSGGVIEKFIALGEETFIAIIPWFLESDAEVQKYGIQSRMCFFPNEVPNNLKMNYGINKCLTQCRINSINILCKCIPFYYNSGSLLNFEEINYEKIQFCTLQHKSCLEKYKFKWINVVTQRTKSKELEKEMEDSLFCPECFPLCANTQLRVKVNSLPIREKMLNTEILRNITMNIEELAVLRIFFRDSVAKYYKQTLKNFWFEVFSTIGGICGLMTGLSLGALCQIIFAIIMACKKIYLISIRDL